MNLDACLKELGKEFRKLSGTKMPAEIVLIGGASVLINYGFREMTYDVDAVIQASSAMKDAINRVRDKFDLPHGWLNTDFKRTTSYSDRLAEVSVYYKTFSNVLAVRTVAAEYLIAMKLMSGRQYKHDLSDIVGILWEHDKKGKPIDRAVIDIALEKLYQQQPLPEVSQQLLGDAFANGDYGRVFSELREREQQAKEVLLDFEQENPNTLNEDNINDILEQARRKRTSDKEVTQ
jgi:hypothetical protein